MDIVYFPRDTNDREDWIEDTIQPRIAMQRGHNVIVGDANKNHDGAVIIGNGFKQFNINLGTPLWPRLEQVSKANTYALSDTFANHAGRMFELSEFTPEQIEEAVKKIDRPCFVKFVAYQKATSLCKVDPTEHIEAKLHKHYMYEFVRLGRDNPNECMTQERVDMNYEYRVFVVDGEPVTGAGCVEVHTPLENTTVFNSAMEKNRNGGHIEDRLDLSQSYERFARDVVCPSFAEEGFVDYSLDLFQDGKNGELGIIEINPIHPSGMYAIDYPKYFDSVISVLKQNQPT